VRGWLDSFIDPDALQAVLAPQQFQSLAQVTDGNVAIV
jgi:hypothetical protein